MENNDKTTKHLEMAAVKADHHPHVADDIDWCVSQIDFFLLVAVGEQLSKILNCPQGIIASHIGRLMET